MKHKLSPHYADERWVTFMAFIDDHLFQDVENTYKSKCNTWLSEEQENNNAKCAHFAATDT